MSQVVRPSVPSAAAPAAATGPAEAGANWSGPEAVRACKVFMIDDEAINLKVVQRFLAAGGFEHFVAVQDPTNLWSRIEHEHPDVVLLDLLMPEISGFQVLTEIRGHESSRFLPVLVLTAADDPQTKARALRLGATDFLSKPVDPNELIPRVRNAALAKMFHDRLQRQNDELEAQVRRRTTELETTRLQLVQCLARAAEFRDNDTGLHVRRVGRYAAIIAQEMGQEPHYVEMIELAAALHDVGKIGVSDDILLKPARLDPAEIEVMQRHTLLGKRVFQPLTPIDTQSLRSHSAIGASILSEVSFDLFEMASRIALTHHEWWDGRGYPLGLAGTDIPLEGRITAVADVFDALSSRRPYKRALPVDQCVQMMQEQRGIHFDPAIFDAFANRRAEILSVQINLSDME
jgi:putative two-component system response regulator